MFYSVSPIIIMIVSASCVLSSDDTDLINIKLNKVMRQMVNQTKADTLNLPSNSTTIRVNIVDTFSCENRTYGYYADVDNDCQIFHVCLPRSPQGRGGKNLSFRWSFICPKETIFNQEVLVCTRSRESIDCQDAPYYYDVNLQFGDINKTENDLQKKDKSLKSNYVYKRKSNIVVKNIKGKAIDKEQRVKDEEKGNGHIDGNNQVLNLF